MVTIRYSRLRMFSIILLSIPVFLFFIFWLKPFFSIPLSLLLGFAVYKARKVEEKTIELKVSHLILMAFVIILWLFLCGQGGFFAQKQDNEIRNVVFRDLINYKWPVRYGGDNDESLAYYVGYWLFPSLAGKISKLIFGFNTAWVIARITLFIYSFTHIFCCLLLLCFKIERLNWKKVAILLSVFIFFSGMDAIGSIGNSDYSYHIEWWAGFFQYSSMTTQLGWVYNQALPTWLLMSLVLNEKDEKAYGLIGLCILPSAPLPLVGAASYMIYLALINLFKSLKNKNVANYLRTVFSITNILSAITIVPVFWFYYNNNSFVGNSEAVTTAGTSSFDYMGYFVLFFLFVILEFGLLLMVIFKETDRINAIYVAVALLIVPHIHFGNSIDFCMRASIPGLFILMVMVIMFLIKEEKRDKVRTVIVSIILIMGAVTALIEFRESATRYIKTNGKCVNQYDYLMSLEELPLDYKHNFVGVDSSNSIFFKYLAISNK